jgi:hypothetical protein
MLPGILDDRPGEAAIDLVGCSFHNEPEKEVVRVVAADLLLFEVHEKHRPRAGGEIDEESSLFLTKNVGVNLPKEFWVGRLEHASGDLDPGQEDMLEWNQLLAFSTQVVGIDRFLGNRVVDDSLTHRPPVGRLVFRVGKQPAEYGWDVRIIKTHHLETRRQLLLRVETQHGTPVFHAIPKKIRIGNETFGVRPPQCQPFWKIKTLSQYVGTEIDLDIR